MSKPKLNLNVPMQSPSGYVNKLSSSDMQKQYWESTTYAEFPPERYNDTNGKTLRNSRWNWPPFPLSLAAFQRKAYAAFNAQL